MSPSDDPSLTRLDELNDNRATGSEFLGRFSNPHSIGVDPEDAQPTRYPTSHSTTLIALASAQCGSGNND
jgi:hypothetical protein